MHWADHTHTAAYEKLCERLHSPQMAAYEKWGDILQTNTLFGTVTYLWLLSFSYM